MSGDTQQTKHGRRNTSTESGDKYRQVFSWCSGHEDQEIFRRHSLHDRYTTASINQTNSTETKSHLPEWPALADDSQRRSLDIMIKTLKPEELHPISHLKTPQTKNTACSDNALKLQNMEGKSTAKQTCQVRPSEKDPSLADPHLVWPVSRDGLPGCGRLPHADNCLEPQVRAGLWVETKVNELLIEPDCPVDRGTPPLPTEPHA
uniref:Uncharacterized protein n=1 Tax=Biomphalaria glabrata TaxID=6526 RepID=A0A2C9LLU4_BIOGL